MRNRIDPGVAASLRDAVRAIEASSRAEVVVEVRAQSGSYAHADARFGAIAAFVAMNVILFSPWEFDPLWVPGIIVLSFAAGMLASINSTTIRRLMTTRTDRDRKLAVHAAAAFVSQGADNTTGRTGLLVLLSLLERRIEVVADRGVMDAVPVLEWNRFAATARSRGADAALLGELLRELATMLSKYMPVEQNDRDELPNEVRMVPS